MSGMAIAIVLGARRRLSDERGAIALLTLAFMIFAGLACVVILWGIGYATGAYNALYTATQSAAYSAATSTARSPLGDRSRDQLFYRCTRTATEGECVGGQTFAIARSVLAQSLAPGVPGRFGLVFGRNVCLIDNTAATNPNVRCSASRRDVVYAYDVDSASGASRTAGACSLPGRATVDNRGGFLRCWRVLEGRRVLFPPQYVSGVVVRTAARIQAPPGCGLAFCEISLRAVAGATQAQPSAPGAYSDYGLYTN